jgi:hypothetical protein
MDLLAGMYDIAFGGSNCFHGDIYGNSGAGRHVYKIDEIMSCEKDWHILECCEANTILSAKPCINTLADHEIQNLVFTFLKTRRSTDDSGTH